MNTMASLFSNGRLFFLLLLAMVCFICSSASPHPFSEEDRVSAIELLVNSEASISSLEGKYQLLRSFQVLGVSHEEPITCPEIAVVLTSSSTSLKDAFYASKIGEALSCSFKENDLKVTASNLLMSLSSIDSLLDLRFATGALAFMKNWIKDDLVLENAVDIFHKVEALGEEDGTWKYGTNDDEASAKAAGIALETLAELIKVARLSIDDAKIRYVKGVASKLFESIEKYEDGAHFFAEKSVDTLNGVGGLLAATSCVVKGVATIASVSPGELEISPVEVVGLANFFLSAGIPGSHIDMFHILEALDALDNNSFLVPLVLSVYPSVLSLTAKDILQVRTTTILGSPVPATVTLRKAVRASDNIPTLVNQVLESGDNSIHTLDLINNLVDFGVYDLMFKVKPSEGKYAVDSNPSRRILVTGVAIIAEVEVGVLDSDTASADVMKKWDPSTKEVVSLFATHLQKLRFTLDVLSPLNEPFEPHQAFLKLKHESKAEHLFLLKASNKKLVLNLDLLGLVEKLNYLSGVYTIELIVGDAAMENPITWSLGTVELDLPEPSEGIAKPTTVAQVPSKYGPKPEITHKFRPADKRAPPTLSKSFLILSLVPLLCFLIGLKLLNTNFKGFPMTGLPMFAALVFHVGVGSILALYVLFWLQFNLFQTLKLLGILASFLTVPGYYLLSHLAADSPSAKIKSA